MDWITPLLSGVHLSGVSRLNVLESSSLGRMLTLEKAPSALHVFYPLHMRGGPARQLLVRVMYQEVALKSTEETHYLEHRMGPLHCRKLPAL